MRLSKKLEVTLFGSKMNWIGDSPGKHRKTSFEFPGIGDEPTITAEFRSDDGLILYLLKRIEALEKVINKKKG